MKVDGKMPEVRHRSMSATGNGCDGERGALASHMRMMIFGHLVSRAVCTVVELGIPDVLGDRALGAEELADATGADPHALMRLLNDLSAFDVFAVNAAGRFTLTPLGATLRADAPGSARATALLGAAEFGTAWHALGRAVRTGRSAFEAEHGSDLFGYLQQNADLRSVFYESQAAGLQLELEEVLTAIDLSDRQVLVDVGGGDGTLLAYLLERHDSLRGVLVDREEVLAAPTPLLETLGVKTRCSTWSGDFLIDLPTGADAYLLRHILHDWDDDTSLRVLRTCRERISAEGLLVIIDIVTPHPGSGPDAMVAQHVGAVMDLYMLSVLGGGRERDEPAMLNLLRAAGFTPETLTPTSTGSCVLLARPR